ncbi:MAG: GNAT family N-acetyltransferase [Candidatus Kerfeldbacteria bacterium]|nr:GNAT family N-acetyltransferase [Candidatus Kerfeldbacteria bacterium]
MPIHREPSEQRPNQTITQVDADDRVGVSAYYKFEVDQGFSSFPPETTFDEMVTYRQDQIRSGKLKVAMIERGGQVLATSVVVLEPGTMGKKIANNEAYAAGTLVHPDWRSQGIGELMSAEQDRIARDADREAIKTVVVDNNYASMRLRMKVGYRLEGVDDTKEQPEFVFKKNLKNEPSVKRNLRDEMLAGHLSEVNAVDASSPDTLLIDPRNTDSVEQALAAGYKGVYLLSPADFPEAESLGGNKIVFARAETLSDSVGS